MNPKNDLLQCSPQELIEHLNNEHISRFYFVYDAQNRSVKCSHPQLQPIAEFLQADTRDFMEHEGLFLQTTQHHDIIQGAFVHKTNRGQAAGTPCVSLDQPVSGADHSEGECMDASNVRVDHVVVITAWLNKDGSINHVETERSDGPVSVLEFDGEYVKIRCMMQNGDGMEIRQSVSTLEDGVLFVNGLGDWDE